MFLDPDFQRMDSLPSSTRSFVAHQEFTERIAFGNRLLRWFGQVSFLRPSALARAFVWLILGVTCITQVRAAVLVPLNSTWSYRKGTNEASSPVSAWRSGGFNASGWSSGSMPFFYGEPLSGGTQLNDMLNGYGCVFLRRTFVVTNLAAIAGLDLVASCDDGFVAWINGQEVKRYNVAAVAGSYTDLAESGATEPVVQTVHPLPNPAGYLIAGTNVIAIQLYNVSLGSSDIVLNAELLTVDPDPIPPIQVNFSPPAGEVAALSQVTVQFSEPVIGVDESDLRLNGAMAESVTAETSSRYTFTYFPQPFGPIQVGWNAAHGITDLARPGNAFDAAGPGTSWQYTVVDNVSPMVALITPPAGRSVRHLSQVEVTFSEPVVGVDAADLLINGQPATNLVALGAGSYVFQFAFVTSGTAQLNWIPGHGIRDLGAEPNGFAGGSWSYSVDPGLVVGDLVINEFLAANESGLLDEDGEPSDWIEIFNRGATAVNLLGWSLTDDEQTPGQWTFPAVTLGASQHLVVFASGKDRKPTAAGSRLHTNFKLSAAGEYLGLFSYESPRAVVDDWLPEFPQQRNDHSFGRQPGTNTWRYFAVPSPGAANGASPITGITPPVYFSVERGFFNVPFDLSLYCEAPDAVIRYTLNGSAPTAASGLIYANPLRVDRTTLLRAAAFRPNGLPSEVATHSYLFNLSAGQRSLPVISVVTATNNLFGPTGIMEVNPRNTTQHGLAWERPVSVEYIRPQDNDGFQLDAGLRIQGGGYVRERYDPLGSLPFSKYSFRLYFRGDYGTSRLNYPLFPGSPVEEFDRLVLRAGMNDHSNPFILDELCRRLFADTGQVSSHGANAVFYLNGVYKGYYNPCERIDSSFLQSWHGGDGNWDLIQQFGEVGEGDDVAWNALRNYMSTGDLTQNSVYQEVTRQLDVTNFVDYLLVNVYAAMGDWPHNNWRAAREKSPGGRFRYYLWDGEWAFGFSSGFPVSRNTLANELNGTTDVANFYRKLVSNAEFRLLWADRFHKHFYHGGALTDARVLARFTELKTNMAGILPGMNNTIQGTWIPQRRAHVIQHLNAAGLFASSNAPAFSQHGGRVRRGFDLALTAPTGTIYYTTNGADPRVAFSGAVSADAAPYAGVPLRLNGDLVVRARTLSSGTWSALTEAPFSVGGIGPSIRITEIMYNPPGGDAYEFVELFNAGGAPVDLGLMTFVGVDFLFPINTLLGPGETFVLASDEDPVAFAGRYPGVRVDGRFGGSLSNGGERLALLDPQGNVIVAVSYDDSGGWPLEADGNGYSLEFANADGDPDAADNWRRSRTLSGSPGVVAPGQPGAPAILFNEVMAENLTAVPKDGGFPDWIELLNPGAVTINLSGWRLSDGANDFVFAAGTTLDAGNLMVIWCDTNSATSGIHSGFGLSRNGESLFLYDAAGVLVDAIGFGLQIADRTIGRSGGNWRLNQPTPGAVNVEASTGSQASLVLNEWLANAVPGGDDWIELFNLDGTLPVSLKGIGFTTTAGGIGELRSLSFIAPAGHVVLRADENPGADHLPFKLPATGTTLVLHDDTGAEVNRVAFGLQIQGVTEGRYPDGAASILYFPTTPSPGASNYIATYSGPVINEVLARSSTLTNAAGRPVDWVELYNPGATHFDLSQMSLSDNAEGEGRWLFPAGVTIAPNGYRVILFDPDRPASLTAGPELNAGRGLNARSGGVFLYNTEGQLVNSVAYGFQVPDQSIGSTGGAWRLLSSPTPAADNALAAALGSTSNLRLNEWMPNPAGGGDWIEVYNLDVRPVELTGLHLSDDPSIAGATRYKIGPLSFIGGGGWAKWEADGDPTQGGDHLNFNLNWRGQTLRLNSATGTTIDSISFGPLAPGVSGGRLPDGGTNLVQFVTTPTPDSSNYLPLPTLVINELLSHTDPPFEDAVELFNPGGVAVDVGGWFLSDDPGNLRKYRIATGTMIPPLGYRVFYETNLNGGAGSIVPFTFNSARGDSIHLAQIDGAGALTGLRAVAEFGPAANGVSFGRYLTSTGGEFVAMKRHSFGVDSPASVTEFRTGAGATNSQPLVGPVVISEIMFHPVSPNGTNLIEAPDEEYVELENTGATAVPLWDNPDHPENTWRLAGGIDFHFPTNTIVPAQGRVLIANFDPVAAPATLAAFRSKYGVPAGVAVLGPFSGRLSNGGEIVALNRPDSPQLPGTPDAGLVPYILVERIAYSAGLPWPTGADGTGDSLQRRVALDFGNDPVNWQAAPPTAGMTNGGGSGAEDADADGMPDGWEEANGFDKNNASDAGLDRDQDGMTNLQEYLAGTDPSQASSALRFISVESTAGGVKLRFEAMANRTYTVEYRDALSLGSWRKLTDVNGGASPQIAESIDPAATGEGRYYRLVTPATP